MAVFANNSSAMYQIAALDSALDAVFSVTSARTIIFDSGKTTADILMRQSSNARNWLTANMSTVFSTPYQNTDKIESGKYYWLTVRHTVSGSNSREGFFLGDYRTGVTTNPMSTTEKAVQERCSPLAYGQNQSSSASSFATVVKMN
jgi:hypothetical protein